MAGERPRESEPAVQPSALQDFGMAVAPAEDDVGVMVTDVDPNGQAAERGLQPGDVISTGTPPGVGLGFKPPRYLKGGEVMRLGIEGLGVQQQRVTRQGE